MSKLTHIAAAMAAMMAVPAVADTPPVVAAGTIYGGGATLPVVAYVGAKWLGFSPAKRLNVTTVNAKVLDAANPVDTTSLFGQFSLTPVAGKQYKVSYCATGSGTGRNIIRGAVDATGACGDYSGTPAGFSALDAFADFVGSDLPFPISEVTTFATSTRVSTRVAPVQFPAIAGAIGIIYNNADLGNTQLNLTESQLCQIFAGTINNWNQLNATLPSKAIVVVPRSDSSGTTFSFTNHLSAVCPKAYPTAVTGFSTNTRFITLRTAGYRDIPGGGINGLAPTGALPASGNAGVVTQVLAADGTIGYAEVADAKARALAGSTLLRYATISLQPNVAAYTEIVKVLNADGTQKLDKNGKPVTTKVKYKAVVYKKLDPIKDFPASIAVTAKSDTVLGYYDAGGNQTLVGPIALSSGATPGCIQTVDPSTYAYPALTTNVPADYTQYPIMAVSYLLGYNYGNSDFATSGNHNKADALRTLFKLPYGISSKVKTIGKKTGFAALSLTFDNDAAATTATALVDACVKN